MPSKATERHDRAIRRASREGNYKDPARNLGTSMKSKRKRTNRLARDKAAKTKTPAIYEPEDNPIAVMRSRSERMAVMFFALQTSVELAAEEYGVHKDSIYRWFKEEGGLAEVRAYIAARVETSLHHTIDLFLQDLPRRLETLDDETYFDTFQALLNSAEKAGLFRDRGVGRGGKRVTGESGDSPEEPDGSGIHFHITAPPASDSSSAPTPTPTPDSSPPKAEDKNPSVFDE